jgi:hypothetical protein
MKVREKGPTVADPYYPWKPVLPFCRTQLFRTRLAVCLPPSVLRLYLTCFRASLTLQVSELQLDLCRMAAGKGKERWLALLLFLGALVLTSGASFDSRNEAFAEPGVSSDPVAPPTPPTSLPPLVKVPFNWFDGSSDTKP